jgi:hypothetical protein
MPDSDSLPEPSFKPSEVRRSINFTEPTKFPVVSGRQLDAAIEMERHFRELRYDQSLAKKLWLMREKKKTSGRSGESGDSL